MIHVHSGTDTCPPDFGDDLVRLRQRHEGELKRLRCERMRECENGKSNSWREVCRVLILGMRMKTGFK